MIRRVALIGLLLWAGQVAAQSISERPVARPESLAAPVNAPPRDAAALATSERPKLRPGRTSEADPDPSNDTARSGANQEPETSGTVDERVAPSGAVAQPRRGPDAEMEELGGERVDSSARPSARSNKVEQTARQKRRRLEQGAICEDVDIQGDVVGRVTSSVAGCGVESAVRVTSVAGVTLSQHSVMDCGTATALKSWVTQSAKPALSDFGGGLKSLTVAAHYVCKTRNGQSGARISEHGKGRAIDISGFNLQDGQSITVRSGWNAASTAQVMRKLHRSACGPFGTVLGPEADSFHQGHFHFDTARYRSGPYCR